MALALRIICFRRGNELFATGLITDRAVPFCARFACFDQSGGQVRLFEQLNSEINSQPVLIGPK